MKENEMRNRRILAFLFAPLIPSLFLVIALRLTDPKLAAFVRVFSLSFSYLPCILFGIPAIRFLKKRGALSVVSISRLGILLGVVAFYIFGYVIAMALGSPRNIVPSFGELVSGALLGVSVALPFSLIAGFPLSNLRKSGRN